MDRAIAVLDALERDSELLDENAYSERAAALEELEYAHEVLAAAGRPGRHALRRLQALRRALETINQTLYDRLRGEVRAGTLRGTALRRLLDEHTAYRPSALTSLHLELEPVDGLIDGILGLEAFRGEPTLTDRDFVHLEDTPARVLLDLVDHVAMGPDDLFVDLGSGLGRAAMLVHLLTGSPALGVEVQPEYCAFAHEAAAALGLDAVRFEQTDARLADLSRGTVFYLFTPFKGRILREVFYRLESESRSRCITVCTYGAVSLVAAQERWLAPASEAPPHEFTLAVWRSASHSSSEQGGG